MVGLEGIGGVKRPANTEPADLRSKKAARTPASVDKDSVAISSKAQGAAEATRLAGIEDPELRMERVERARANIEKGTYKMQSVVRMVAARMSKYL